MAKNFRHKKPKDPHQDGEVFKVLRLIRGTKSSEVARATDLAPSTISKLRTRRTRYPRFATIMRIAKAMGYRYELVSEDKDEEVEDHRGLTGHDPFNTRARH